MARVFDGSFFRNRSWILVRRLVLILILLVLAYRNYGPALDGWFRAPLPSQLIRVTQTEFRRDVAGAGPSWFVGLRNESPDTTYEDIVLETTYSDGEVVLERGEMIVEQPIAPGEEILVGRRDSQPHQGATEGWVRVVSIQPVH